MIEAYVEHDLSPEEIARRGLGDARGGPARGAPGRPGRVQAAAGPAGHQGAPQGVRSRPAAADHQPLRALSRLRATGASARRRTTSASCARSEPWRGSAGTSRARCEIVLSTCAPRANACSASRRSCGHEYDPGRRRAERLPSARTVRRCTSSARDRERVRHPCECQIRSRVTAKSRPALARKKATE